MSAIESRAGRSFGVRPATENDLPAIARVHRETVATAYAGLFPPTAPVPSVDGLLEDWERTLSAASNATLVAELGGAIVGTVAVRPEPDSVDCGQLRRLHVLPAHWGNGIGTALHDAALEILVPRFPRAALWVLRGNARAREMYERHGWTLVPDRTLEWPDLGVVEVRYVRELRSSE